MKIEEVHTFDQFNGFLEEVKESGEASFSRRRSHMCCCNSEVFLGACTHTFTHKFF